MLGVHARRASWCSRGAARDVIAYMLGRLRSGVHERATRAVCTCSFCIVDGTCRTRRSLYSAQASGGGVDALVHCTRCSLRAAFRSASTCWHFTISADIYARFVRAPPLFLAVSLELKIHLKSTVDAGVTFLIPGTRHRLPGRYLKASLTTSKISLLLLLCALHVCRCWRGAGNVDNEAGSTSSKSYAGVVAHGDERRQAEISLGFWPYLNERRRDDDHMVLLDYQNS